MAIFYVFQGKTYEHELAGGYVWSPKLGKGGKKNKGYYTMLEIKKGDFIIHQADTAIQAISIAKTDCYDSQQPLALKNADKDIEWDDEGYRVDVDYVKLDVPLNMRNYKEWLVEHWDENSAFKVTGIGKLQYMCNVTNEHVLFLMGQALKHQHSTSVKEIINRVMEEAGGRSHQVAVDGPRHWILPCNIGKYDVIGAFGKSNKIIWKQSINTAVNDCVYIYVSAPVQALRYKCKVTKVDMPTRDKSYDDQEFILEGDAYMDYGRYMELTLVETCDIPVGFLQEHGLRGRIQGPLKIHENMLAAINSVSGAAGEELTDTQIEEDRVEAERLSGETLQAKAAAASRRKVKPRQSSTVTYYRNPIIAKAAKERAGGICQLCGMPAPFDDKDGNPYLESYHIVWLSQGGEDTVEDTVALCPNCHKRMHVLNEDRAVRVLKSRNRK